MAKLQSKQKQGEIVTGDTENDIDHGRTTLGDTGILKFILGEIMKKFFFLT